MYIKTENLSLDMPEIFILPSSFLYNPLDFWLSLSSSTAFPACFRHQAARQPFLLLLCRGESVKTQRYANLPVSGEARVADSNSGGGGNAPFFMS
ncbi:MAG: hypothetical protein P8171_22385 [Candidatus Thiodiazotropha sp.]